MNSFINDENMIKLIGEIGTLDLNIIMICHK